MLEQGLVVARSNAANPLFKIVCGINYGFCRDSRTLIYARSLLPEHCEWAAFAVGRNSFPFVAQSFLLREVRVGFDDTVRRDRRQLAPSNAAMVQNAVPIISDLGGETATAAEARSMLGLCGRGNAPKDKAHQGQSLREATNALVMISARQRQCRLAINPGV